MTITETAATPDTPGNRSTQEVFLLALVAMMAISANLPNDLLH